MASNGEIKKSKDGMITVIIGKIAMLLTGLTDKVEHIKGKAPETVALILYFASHLLMLFVHEPWFDEALAWLIARDSSIYELIFVAPHYEGHPSLWHLVLAPFAKLGAPYELSLSAISIAFTGFAMALFIYKAPFKRIIRILVPFTYFLIYQYSAISRPYSMMVLAFVLMAVTYNGRDKHPGWFILSLLFLCMTSAYGIVIAGGICIAWLIKMVYEAHWCSINRNSENGEYKGTIKIFCDNLLSKGKLFWLIFLLAYAIFILIRIIPAEDNRYVFVYGDSSDAENGILIRMLYTFFAVISDLFVTNVYYNLGNLQNVDFKVFEFCFAVIIGIGILAVLGFYLYRKKHMLEFTIPYIMLGVFASVIYLWNHHIGIFFLYFGFVLWAVKDEEKRNLESAEHNSTKPTESVDLSIKYSKDVIKNNSSKLLSDLSVIFIYIMIIIPIYWGIASLVCDVVYEYAYGKNEYQYLKDHNLEHYTSVSEPQSTEYDEQNPDEFTQGNLFLSGVAICIAPYLDSDNMLITPEKLGKSYLNANLAFTNGEIMREMESLESMPAPDIIFGIPPMEILYGIAKYTDYTLVYENRSGVIWKGIPGYGNSYLYLKNELVP